MKYWKAASMVALAANMAVAADANLTLNYRYTEADTNRLVKGEKQIALDLSRDNMSDEKIAKTLFVLELGKTLKASMKDFHAACKVEPKPIPMPRPFPVPGPAPIDPIRPILPGPIDPILPEPPKVDPKCVEARVKAAELLIARIEGFERQMDSDASLRDARIVEFLELGTKLAENMLAKKDDFFGPIFRDGGIRKLELASVGGAGALNVTAGGAQDVRWVKKLIRDGQIPADENLAIEGFLSEFDLSLSPEVCDELICIRPEVKVDADKKKLFMQMAMSSNMDAAAFERKPLNLSIVLDISGSMSATDRTDKKRIAWAKDALMRTVEEMNEEDMLSIVLFNQESSVLLEPTRVEDKEGIAKLVDSIKAGGSTNLEAGLVSGYELVSRNLQDVATHENRVILITDANLNTGVTGESPILQSITNHANEGIGLTAIGVGVAFNQKFIHNITMSKGGSYIFAQSGADLLHHFERFDFLVTPIAYGLKASIDFQGVAAKIAASYGVPMREGQEVRELIDVQTLFFSEEGGAIVLEFDLQ